MSGPWAQEGFRARLAWGPRGARAAAARGDLLVVVDVLSFSTAAAVAVSRGAAVLPCPPGPAGADLARARGAHLAVKREEVPARGRFSLSPGSLRGLEPGETLVLPSPNGAACAALAREGAREVLTAGLVNAAAVAAWVQARLAPAGAVTVLACGERWPEPDPADGTLRVAVEDLLGAGAVLAGLPAAWRSPEAEAAVGAFLHLRSGLARALLGAGSGRELVERGFADDVQEAAALDALSCVPRLSGALLCAAEAA